VLAVRKGLEWKVLFVTVRDIVFVLFPLRLPNYVLLEIIDWLPHLYYAAPHKSKIRLIENVNRSCRKVKGRRVVDGG
jgi:hypothetical protein